MIEPLQTAAGDTDVAESCSGDGWYLYGIARRDPVGIAPAWPGWPDEPNVEGSLDLGPDHAQVRLLACGRLAAVVKQVPLADFTTEALQARLADPTALAASVREHDGVIRAVHQRQTILPAKFGAVYARLEDIEAALEHRHDTLLAQLERLAGCDEWAVHVYVNHGIVQNQVRADHAADPAMQQLAATRPGRAYFLRRRFDEALATKTREVAEDAAQMAYRRLSRLAAESIADRPAHPSHDEHGDMEVLRASFLVRREQRDAFIAEVCACRDTDGAWRCTYSGPWPPYSFAAIPDRDDDGHQDA